ncbi:protein FAM149B1 isoform X1 [Gadus chalcogrammus]|uniref:protein FAM149B1 isoform X1 n=1 Tax=Gadus chalcogrammus TaxID=1042646 RepID=UPI0024C4AF80|nr:protein FAM149B1 isoform X1 [Gadus chalcogrammus]
MISRYNRRPVSHKLEIRGLSRNSLDHHPHPDEVDDVRTPQHYLHDLQEAVSTHNSSQTSAASGPSDCPTVVTGDINQSWSGIHSYTGTGISTERSSVFSWGYDEFDNAASRQVQQMFEEIDRELYEGRGGAGGQLRGLQDECQQWATRFPHLRILGTQLVCPSDEGFQWYATSGKSSSSIQPAAETDGASTTQDKDRPATELNVQGRRAELVEPPQAEEPDGPRDASGCSLGHDGARVILAEGLMEEYLAFDSRDLDEELEQESSELDRRRRCLPPVSPYRCRRQAVLDLLFDDVWRQLVGCMGELVQRHWEGCISDDEKNLSPCGQQDPQSSFMLLSTLPTTLLPRLDQSRPSQLTASPQSQNPKSRGLKHKSRRKSKKQKKPSTTTRVPVGAAATHQNLNDLIVIHGIPLQQRNTAALEKALEKTQEPEERPDRQASHRPASSAVPSSKSRPRRPLEQSFSSLPRPAQSSRRRNPPPRTLLPLVPGPPQSSGVGSMDEVIRGTRLATAGDRLAPPLTPLGRNTLLPPISTGEPETHSAETGPGHHAPHPRTSQRQRGSSSRAHSAVVDDAAAVSHHKERHHLLLDAFSRPNTTHTYRSDTPYRRSFTVLDNIGQGRQGRASVGIDSLGIGVTGISLGISSSSFLDSFSHHPLGHSPIEDEEEPDTAAPLPAVPGPAMPTRGHARGAASSRSNRPGF